MMAASRLSPELVSIEEAKRFACTACSQRKVRCNKRHPCQACTRSHIPCVYRSTPPPLRRKRKLEESNHSLVERLQNYEVLLRSAGLPFEPFEDLDDTVSGQDEGREEAIDSSQGQSILALPNENSNVGTQTPQQQHRGILVSEYGGKRYYEFGLIGTLGQEYRQGPLKYAGQDGLQNTSQGGPDGPRQQASDMIGSNILTGLPSTFLGTTYQHPSTTAVMKYWSIFEENVHPLTKIIHAPSTSRIMSINISSMSKSTEALRFSIYACAVASLTERQSIKFFGESLASLLHTYQVATSSALAESSFLTVPDMDLLRAYVLLLTSMFNNSDPASLWILMGSVIRLAQSQGLHRDGSALGLSPFEVEMRRRLWWYIVTVDARLTEVTGSESALPYSRDASLPSNFDDKDLDPEMSTLPPERPGASEMTFCLLQYEIVSFLQCNDPRTQGSDSRPPAMMGKSEERRSISDLESFLQDKFLRFCDPIVPVQFLTTTIARSTLCKLRQLARHRKSRHDPHDTRTMTSEQINSTLNIAARNVEYDNLIHSNRSLEGFFWHVNFHFPWGAPIFILVILASHYEWNDDMESAWAQIEELHGHHPEYMHADKILHSILIGLTLKAWAARETGLKSKDTTHQHTPSIIRALHTEYAALSAQQIDFGTNQVGVMYDELNFADMSAFDTLNTGNFELVDPTLTGVGWSSWGAY